MIGKLAYFSTAFFKFLDGLGPLARFCESFAGSNLARFDHAILHFPSQPPVFFAGFFARMFAWSNFARVDPTQDSAK